MLGKVGLDWEELGFVLLLELCGVGAVIIIRIGGVGVEAIVRARVRANPNPWN